MAFIMQYGISVYVYEVYTNEIFEYLQIVSACGMI